MMSHRYCVIMCGGVGSRFWPYSREDRPKQFIDFLGTGRSLLQMSYDRILPLVPKENIVVVTNEYHQYRADIYARRAGLRVGHHSAHTALRLFPNQWVREWGALAVAILTR